MKSPNSSVLNPLTHDLSSLGFIEVLLGMSSPRAGKGHILFSKNVQVSCSLLELRGRHSSSA